MKRVFDIRNDSSLHRRTQITEKANKSREREIEYLPDQQVFIRNPNASRRNDQVLASLPIHIYTKEKRVPCGSRQSRIGPPSLLPRCRKTRLRYSDNCPATISVVAPVFL